MFEVFNAMTGETVGYVEHKASAAVYSINLSRRTGQMHDYIDADRECSCTFDDNHCGNEYESDGGPCDRNCGRSAQAEIDGERICYFCANSDISS